MGYKHDDPSTWRKENLPRNDKWVSSLKDDGYEKTLTEQGWIILCLLGRSRSIHVGRQDRARSSGHL
jgi:hypothetical protein